MQFSILNVKAPPAMKALHFDVFVVTDGTTVRNITTNETEAKTRAQYANQKPGSHFRVEAATACLIERTQSSAARVSPSTHR